MITGNAMQSVVQIAPYMLCSIDAGAKASKCWCVLVCVTHKYMVNFHSLGHLTMSHMTTLVPHELELLITIHSIAEARLKPRSSCLAAT